MTATVPVLLYHAVSETPGDVIAPYTVTPSMFQRQLDVLLEEGYTCITFSALMDLFALGDAPEKTAVITFDDGYADFAEHGLPALVQRELPSTMYLTTGFMEGGSEKFHACGPTDRMLDWAQLPDLVAGDVEIGAHSHRHPEMDTLSPSNLKEEAELPKRLLEEALGTRVRSFAYPHGYNGSRVRKFIRAAGYDNAAGVRNALTHRDDDPFNIARLMLRSDHSIDTFRSWLQGQADVASEHELIKTKGWRMFRRSKALARRQPGSIYSC